MIQLPFKLSQKEKINAFLLKHNAVLVGSRFYMTNKLYSDWDYMVVSNNQLYTDMDDMADDWTRLYEGEETDSPFSDYLDDQYTYACYTITVDGTKIDIQIMKDQQSLNAKMKIYETIRNYDIFKGLDKTTQQIIFRNMIGENEIDIPI